VSAVGELARTLAWDGPEPVRVEAASVVLGADRLTARGSSTSADHVVEWALVTGAGWVTRSLSVRARGDGWARSLELGRGDAGGWTAVRAEDGQPAEPLEVAGLEGALDCDLALCPFTNTMPVLRHDLVAAARQGRSTGVDLVMAWVSVPGLTLEVSPQRYAAVGPAPGGGAAIAFASGDFQAVIEFDGDGLVRRYPGLARRLTAEA
jgi:hypothetical protein